MTSSYGSEEERLRLKRASRVSLDRELVVVSLDMVRYGHLPQPNVRTRSEGRRCPDYIYYIHHISSVGQSR